MRYRSTLFPLFIVMLFSFLLAACSTPVGGAAAPGDPAGIRAAAPAGAPGQGAQTVAPAVVVDGSPPAPAAAETPAEPITRHQTLPLAENAGELTAAEATALRYLLEEEKLAHDLYAAFFELWGLPTFDNIAAAEAQHMASVLPLLSAYDLADPVAGLAAGQFADAGLQALYDEMLAQGTLSSADALLAGALVEEIDVADLERALAETTNPDLIQLFTNLRLGSANHLLAFSGNYERQSGNAYTPQHLNDGAYSALLAEATARRGNGSRSGGAGDANGQPGHGAGPVEQGTEQRAQRGDDGRAGNGNGYRGGRG